MKKILSLACLSVLAGCTNSVLKSTAPASEPTNTPKAAVAPAVQSKTLTPPKSTVSYQIETYQSQIFGGERTYGVVLPPGYAQNQNQQYPVIFLLHGGHGDPTAWFIKGNALKVIQALYKDGRLPPSIIITPDGNDSRGTSPYWDPEYINGRYGNLVSAIGDELVKEIKQRYRTRPEPEFWAIGGLSSGGWGAMNVGLHYPETFKTMFSHSGYFVDKSGAENSPIDYIKTIDPQTRKSIAIYVDAGEGDGVYLTQSQEFHQVLDQLEVKNQFNEFPGGHGVKGQEVGWGFWHKHLADSLAYVGQRFQSADQAISKR